MLVQTGSSLSRRRGGRSHKAAHEPMKAATMLSGLSLFGYSGVNTLTHRDRSCLELILTYLSINSLLCLQG